MQELILKAFNKEDFSKELEAVTDFYDSDFERFNLESQLQLLHQIGLKFKEQSHKRFTIQDVITLMQKWLFIKPGIQERGTEFGECSLGFRGIS